MKWLSHKKQALNRDRAPAQAPVWRSRLVLGVLAVAFLILAGRAAWLQMWNEQFLKDRAEKLSSSKIEIPATRGRILDRNGEILAVSSPMKAIWIAPGEAEPAAPAIGRLASLLDMPVRDVRQRFAQTEREFVYLKRGITPEAAANVAELKIPRVNFRDEYRRFYPGGDVMSHVLGFTDINDVGQEGIERALESALAGKPGSRRVIKDRLGHIVEDRESKRAPAENGRDVHLALDGRIQSLALRFLKEAVVQHRAKGGSVVVLDARSGEILALTNYPTFNPNNRTKVDPNAARNRALIDVFEPGSTLKPLTVALAIESGKVTAKTPIATAPGRFMVGRATIHDAHPAGTLTVAEVIQKSSNVGTAKIALGLAPESMWQMFKTVGFGTSPQLGFPGEASGRLRPFKSWRPIEQATMSYGHGISISLVQLARAYSVFAREGDIVPLSLTRLDAPTPGQSLFSAATVRDVRAMLEAAVSPQGTAPRAQIMGYRVAGKTGTAHKHRIEGGYEPDKYISSFVGLAPASQPRLVVAVMIDDPRAGQYYGGVVAAPVFANVMQGALRALSIPYDAAMKPIELPPPAAELRESM